MKRRPWLSLDISSLKKSIAALERSVTSYHIYKNSSPQNKDILDTLQSGVIQDFEVAYEQCWKYMKRWIEENISREDVDGVPRRELFRISAENSFISDIEKWMVFHRARNLTSHTYDENNANFVFQEGQIFLIEAKKFLIILESKNDSYIKN